MPAAPRPIPTIAPVAVPAANASSAGSLSHRFAATGPRFNRRFAGRPIAAPRRTTFRAAVPSASAIRSVFANSQLRQTNWHIRFGKCDSTIAAASDCAAIGTAAAAARNSRRSSIRPILQRLVRPLQRKEERLALNQFHNRFKWQRMAQPEALRLVETQLAHQRELALGLNPLSR